MKGSTLISAIVCLSLIISDCKREHFHAYNNYPRFSENLKWSDGPYKLHGLNNLHFIESFPYQAVYPSSCEHCEGITHVYSKAKIKLYTIPRYFKVDNIFISADGRSILYFNDNCSDSNWESCPTDLIQHYSDGKLSIAYASNSFGHDPDKYGYWLYNDIKENEWLTKNHLYSIGDTVYAINRRKQVFRFSITSSGKLIDSIRVTQYLQRLNYLNYPKGILGHFSRASTDELPMLDDSSTIYSSLGKYLNAEVLKTEDEQFNRRKYYKFYITLLIENTGRVKSLKIDVLESILLPQAQELKTRMEKFFQTHRFSKNAVPYKQKEWKFKELIFVQKLPVSLSENEFLAFRNTICRLDSISGIYIPANLEEAISELDRVLVNALKQRVKSGENMQSSLGMDIRNNWRFWSGSRLSCYFNNKGLYHPELMSAVIIEAYTSHLRDSCYIEDSLINQAIREERKNLPCYQ